MNILIMLLFLSALVAPGRNNNVDGTVEVSEHNVFALNLRMERVQQTKDNLSKVLELTIPLTELNPAILQNIWNWTISMYITIPKKNIWQEIIFNKNEVVTDTDKGIVKIPYRIKNTYRHFRAKVVIDNDSLYVDLTDHSEYGSGYDMLHSLRYIDVKIVYPEPMHPRSFATLGAEKDRKRIREEWSDPSTVGFVQTTETILVVTCICSGGTVADFKKRVHFEQFNYHGIIDVQLPVCNGKMVRLLYYIVEKEVTVKLTLSDIKIITVGFKQEEKGWIGFLTGAHQTFRLYGNNLVETNYAKENFEKLLSNGKCVVEISGKIKDGKEETWTAIKVKRVKATHNEVRLIVLQYDLAQHKI